MVILVQDLSVLLFIEHLNIVKNPENLMDVPWVVQVAPKPAIRPGKIPLEKGYSQMDWLRLSRTSSDMAGDTFIIS